MELTQDPYVIILRRGPKFILYFNVETYRSWFIFGECDHKKGKCIIGAVNPDLRPYSERLDIPVTPEFEDCCDLRGEYL